MLIATERWPRPEVTGNLLQTTLSAAITSTSRPITVAPVSTSGWPTVPGFRVLIDSELLLVTYTDGTNWLAETVEGTTAATHSSGATVTQVLTAGALTQIVSDHTGATSATADPHPMYVRTDSPVTEPAWHASYATTIANTARKSRGYFIPSGWGTNFKAARARAQAGTGKCTIAVQGDSIAEGYYVSDFDRDAWPSLMGTAMQLAYGDGGSGWKGTTDSLTFAIASGVPAAAQTYYTNHGYIQQTGTWVDGGTWLTNAGPGGYYMTTQVAGSSATFQVRGSTVYIYTIQNNGAFANWTYSIDGAAPVSVTDGGPSWAIAKTTVATTAGTHSVKITYNDAGTKLLYLCGVAGENSTGVVVNGFCKNGEYSGRWNNRDAFGVGSWSGGTNYPCDLLIYACNANDVNYVTNSGVTLSSAASAGASTIAMSGYLAPGWYTMNDGANAEPFQIINTSGTTAPYTATVAGNIQKAHSSGANIATHNGEPRAWSHNIRLNLNNVLDGPGASGTTDVMILMPHIGLYDVSSGLTITYQQYIREALALCETYNAALVNCWASGNNSWNYMNSLGLWGDSSNPGKGAGTDGVHPNDAGHKFIWNLLAPILMAA